MDNLLGELVLRRPSLICAHQSASTAVPLVVEDGDHVAATGASGTSLPCS